MAAPRFGRNDVLMLLVVSLAALFLRVYGLGNESIWLDEATSLFLARMSIPGMVEWTAVDIHPPLYYACLHVWLALGDGEVQVRLLSVVFGVLSVAVLYLLAQRLFSSRVALAASALLATSPLHVWYSQETRMYAMLTLLALLTSYLMVRALLDQQRWAWPAYLVCVIAALYTHYYAFFVLLFQNIFALYLLWRKEIDGRTWLRWLLVQTLAGIAFLPWLPTMIKQIRSGGGSWVGRSGAPGLSAFVSTATNFSAGPDPHLYPGLLRKLVYALFGFFCLAGIVSFVRSATRRTAIVFGVVYLVAPLGAAWLISQVKPLYSLRYLLPFLPAYYILIGQGLDAVCDAVPVLSARRRSLWAASLAVLLGVGVLGVYETATNAQHADWRGVASHVVAASQQSDVVLFVPGWNAKPFDYYARGRVTVVSDTPIPIQPQDIASLVTETTHGRSRLWFIQTKGHYSDPTDAVGAYLERTYTRLERQTTRENVVVTLYSLAPAR